MGFKEFLSVILVVLPFFTVAGQAAELSELEGDVAETTRIRRESQKKLDDWNTEKQNLELEYQNLRSRLERLEREKLIRQSELANLKEYVTESRRIIRQSQSIEKDLEDFLFGNTRRLDEYVDSGLPFLITERQGRTETLKKLITDPAAGNADKFRRVMEALQIEAEYGDSIEVYPSVIGSVDGEVSADLLRVGSVALFARTPDGSYLAVYDPSISGWRELTGKESAEVIRAYEIAGRRAIAEMVRLPLGRLAEK